VTNVIKQSDVEEESEQKFRCDTPNRGTGREVLIGRYWVSVTEIPARVDGNGICVALDGDVSTVFRPVTCSVTIWPGAMLNCAGRPYPDPTNMGAFCPRASDIASAMRIKDAAILFMLPEYRKREPVESVES